MEKQRHKLKAARYARGLSQEKLSEEIGVTRGTISDWECGKVDPYPYHIGKLCSFFGVKDPAELDLMRKTQQDMSHFNPSRRKFNTQFFDFSSSIISTAAASLLDSEVWERLIASIDEPAALNQTAIDTFQHLIQCCWDFCNCGETSIAEQLLLVFLPSLYQLAEHQKDAARLTAEGLRLQSILSTHQLKMDNKFIQCLQSVEYARRSQDPNTLASSLHELTAALRYTRQSDALFNVFQEALSFSEDVMPIIRAGIYAGSAAAFAQRNRRKEADFYIHLAYEVHAESTTHTLATIDNSLAHLAEYEGIIYLEGEQPQKAYDVLERYTASSGGGSALPERNRLEMLNYQGQAALRLGDVDKYTICLQRGIEGALAIKSKKRLSEALDIFQDIPKQWLAEQPIKQVVERFQLPIKGKNG